jgi:hypothetical protein
MPKKSLKKKTQPNKITSSYVTMLSSIREKDEEKTIEDDSDFLNEFQENHYVITILTYLHESNWFENKQQEQFCVLRLREHPNLNALMIAIQYLTNEPTLKKESRKFFLNTVIFSEDPIKTASIILNLNTLKPTQLTTSPEVAADTPSSCCCIT